VAINQDQGVRQDRKQILAEVFNRYGDKFTLFEAEVRRFAYKLLVGDTGSVRPAHNPRRDNDPSLARTFNDLLARAYIDGERDSVKALLWGRGLTRPDPPTP